MTQIQNSKFKIKNCKKGFTLIELLIVIVIIGVLSTLLMANFIGVRQRARDAQRKSDLRQIQAALEIFRSDFGKYPQGLDISALKNCTCNSNACLGSADCLTTYMQKIPTDPNGSGDSYNGGDYAYQSADGTTYVL